MIKATSATDEIEARAKVAALEYLTKLAGELGITLTEPMSEVARVSYEVGFLAGAGFGMQLAQTMVDAAALAQREIHKRLDELAGIKVYTSPSEAIVVSRMTSLTQTEECNNWNPYEGHFEESDDSFRRRIAAAIGASK